MGSKRRKGEGKLEGGGRDWRSKLLFLSAFFFFILSSSSPLPPPLFSNYDAARLLQFIVAIKTEKRRKRRRKGRRKGKSKERSSS